MSHIKELLDTTIIKTRVLSKTYRHGYWGSGIMLSCPPRVISKTYQHGYWGSGIMLACQPVSQFD